MNTEELEQLALQLAALHASEREHVVFRARSLAQAKRDVGHRLSGTAPNRWGDLMAAGGLIYDADGQALCRVKHLDVRKDIEEVSPNMERTVTRIYITAYREDEGG
jgi:hypothetical protein